MELVERDGRLVCPGCGGDQLKLPEDSCLREVFGGASWVQVHHRPCPEAGEWPPEGTADQALFALHGHAAPNPRNLDRGK